MFRKNRKSIFSLFFLPLMALWMIRDGIMPWWALLVFGLMLIIPLFFSSATDRYRMNRLKNKTRQERYR